MWVDAEELTVQYLKTKNLGVEVFTDLPVELPDEFIRVTLSSSERRTLIHRDSKITIECWAAGDTQRACQLAEQVYAVIDEWRLVPDFGGWIAGPYPQPDPETGCPRYVATFIVRHRAEA